MLHPIASTADLNTFRSTHTNTLICYSATWCGPCRASKPQLEALADKLSKSHLIEFGIVYEEDLGDDLQKEGVQAFPTYVLYQEHGRMEGGRIKGVDLQGVEDMVLQCGKRDPFENVSVGQALGGGGGEVSVEEARKLRLARFGGAPMVVEKEEEEELKKEEVVDVDMAAVASASAVVSEEKSDEVEKVEDVDMADADVSCKEVEMVDPTLELDSALVDQLTESMGFSQLRAQKGLLNSNGSVEGAVEWLLAHQDDADIDDPIEKVPKSSTGVAQSYKCNQCGKILSNMANLELHANKTGHSDFEESTESIKPLTPEEKAEKVKKIKELLAAKRAQREEAEKVDHIESEKQRRFMGKEMKKTREEMEIKQRKNEAYLRKKEKIEARKERERIRAELAKDKAERAANKGKLHTRLGVDGYNPSAIQYNVGPDGKPLDEASSEKVSKVENKSTAKKIDDCIKKVSAYRAGGDGGRCLKVLLAYVRNVADSDDEKFRTINMKNKAYIGRIKPFIGAKTLLLSVGFAPNESNDALIITEPDKTLLSETKAKLEDALAAY